MFRANDCADWAPPGPSRRILIVEDQPDSRTTLRMLLELWGHDVEAVGDGLAGVERALNWRRDAAVVDIGLPGLDGWGVARRVRDALRDDILLIALTGYNRPEDRERSARVGFNYHLSKPADLETLRLLLAD